MIPIPAAILCVAFVVLSAIHFLWVVGGNWGLENAVPSKDGTPLFTPGKALTALVAVVLLGAAFVSVWRTGFPDVGPQWIPRAGVWAIAVVFALRAIGDFKYCGFFKRVRKTRFARKDTLIYSPLCVGISFLQYDTSYLSFSAPRTEPTGNTAPSVDRVQGLLRQPA